MGNYIRQKELVYWVEYQMNVLTRSMLKWLNKKEIVKRKNRLSHGGVLFYLTMIFIRISSFMMWQLYLDFSLYPTNKTVNFMFIFTGYFMSTLS